jgi:hypothetical protein
VLSRSDVEHLLRFVVDPPKTLPHLCPSRAYHPLTEPTPAEALDVGRGPSAHREAFEVEFTTLDGMTAAVATVELPAVDMASHQ